jgi:PPOX class probable F420-dependent enzyme
MEGLDVTQLTPAQIAFLRDNAFHAVITTLRPDGSPHSTIVWVDVDEDGVPGFNTALGRAKPRYIARDPRVSLTVVNPADGYQWLSVSGTARLVEGGADTQIDRLAHKYLGADTYPFRKPDEVRVSVPIAPDRVEARGIDS